jgi:hypothetical protein
MDYRNILYDCMIAFVVWLLLRKLLDDYWLQPLLDGVLSRWNAGEGTRTVWVSLKNGAIWLARKGLA